MRQLPFTNQCNSSLAHILLLHGRVFYSSKESWDIYIYILCKTDALPLISPLLLRSWLWLHVVCVWICVCMTNALVRVSACIDMCSKCLWNGCEGCRLLHIHWVELVSQPQTHKEAYLKKLNTVEVGHVTKCIFVTLFSGIVEFIGPIMASE